MLSSRRYSLLEKFSMYLNDPDFNKLPGSRMTTSVNYINQERLIYIFNYEKNLRELLEEEDNTKAPFNSPIKKTKKIKKKKPV